MSRRNAAFTGSISRLLSCYCLLLSARHYSLISICIAVVTLYHFGPFSSLGALKFQSCML
ncbi:hypothetical protein BDR06DRAFT_775619 [Suillus hirtellus]|nr:hypothetical protein BDR06DRAFT_775619 [Suillus hirtellus]